MAPSIEEPISIIAKEIERNGSEVNVSKTNVSISVEAETGAVGNGAVNIEAASNAETYTILEEPLGTPRQLRVITIGAGAAGLNMARHIELQMENVEHIIYEKNPEVGGTWYENKYPGCTCDLPSHNYQFTWEPNPDWSQFYSPAPEILQYFINVAHKYELYKYIKLSHIITDAAWAEEEGKWFVEIKNLITGEIVRDWCHFLINGSGILNNWKWPDIPGLHSFKGDLMHSAAWKDNYDVKGKKVAVLGCGSSGVQIVPSIQPDVEELVTFIRTPTWITAGFAQNKAGPGGANFRFTQEQKDEFRNNPVKYVEYRKEIENELNRRFKLLLKDTPEQAEAKTYSINEMTTKLGSNKRLIEKMIPDFAVGCRRPTPGNGYLEALSKPNVRVITDHIDKIVPEGIALTTGDVIKVDTFICATGFDISFCPRFSLTGRNGMKLSEQWKDLPTAYMSLGAANFPNYFMFLGPNAPIGHGSVLPIIEHASKYIINVLKKAQSQNIKSLAPSARAVADFNQHIPVFMERTAWATACRSWFKNGTVNGPIVALHPGSRVHWFHMLDEPRYEDFEIEYLSRNRFQYLGNGFSTREGPECDVAWYFDDPEAGYKPY